MGKAKNINKPTDYDIVPYESYPYDKTHPENLYAIGRLFGLNPPDYRKARVLELGCASGGNLIPMAFNLPDGKFTGVDLSSKQTDKGIEQIKELGLDNIILKNMSILDIGPDFPKFDYIIAHGVYSWVPGKVREKILAIIKEHLDKDGIAFISYNTYPGWNMVKSIRELMLFHVRAFDDPDEKADQARMILEFIINGLSNDKSPYGAFLKSEMALLTQLENSYLLHDHLEKVNRPFYFHEFIKDARKNHLEYLADTDLSTMYVPNLPHAVSEHLLAIDDIIKVEQYMDFIRNRRFRSTLLCHENAPIKRELAPEDMEKFFVSSQLAPQKPVSPEDENEIIFSKDEISYKPNDQFSRLAMLILWEQNGKPIAYNKLISEIIKRSGLKKNEVPVSNLTKKINLLRLVFAGVISIHPDGGNFTTHVSDYPETTKLIRFQARQGEAITDLCHRLVRLNIFERILVQYLDGRHDRNAIVENMISHVNKGDIELFLGEKKITEHEKIKGQITKLIDNSLKKLKILR